MSAATTPNFTLFAEFGTAPVGCEVRSWDWSEDENGYRFRSEFDIIPDEVISISSPWSEWVPSLFEETLRLNIGQHGRPQYIVRFTANAPEQQTFTCSAWMRLTEAAELFQAFVDSVTPSL